jgi:formate dehydrogenase maturation protein FdhE
MKNLKEYLKYPDKCPFCDSENTTGGDIDFSGINAWRNIKCNSCLKEWTEEFTITNIE